MNWTAQRPYRPRLSVEITPEEQKRMARLIPYGIGGALYRKLLEQLLDLLEAEPDSNAVIAAVLQDRLTARMMLGKGGD